MDKSKRREWVQHMSSVTILIPGSIGERRRMRQELEVMVYQVEAETADLGMNGGAGRIPSGFCTMMCSVYTWAQLRATLLKACPAGDFANPAHREHYTQWESLPRALPGRPQRNTSTTSWPSATLARWRGVARSN